MNDRHDAHVTDHKIYRELVRIAARPEIAWDDCPDPHSGPETQSRIIPETTMNAPVLPPRPRRPVTVYLSDATLDQLDMLVAILPDAPNRSRLIESFLELQIALLLDPAMAVGPFLEGILDNVTRQALNEIEVWQVPDPQPEPKLDRVI